MKKHTLNPVFEEILKVKMMIMMIMMVMSLRRSQGQKYFDHSCVFMPFVFEEIFMGDEHEFLKIYVSL